jgi:membrane protease YdiL (CAAX protease family)
VSPAGAYTAVLCVLAAANVCGNLWLPAWTYVPVNLAAGASVLLVARAGGATTGDLGLERQRLRRGLLVGTLAMAAVGIAIALAVAIPATRGFFEDERATEVGVGLLLYHALLRIPLGTAAFEELAFRGVLLGLGRRLWRTRTAVIWSSVLFGLWHVLPATTLASANAQIAGVNVVLTVTAGVAATIAAGVLLALIRLHSNSLAAPVLAHVATNSFAFAAAWILFQS